MGHHRLGLSGRVRLVDGCLVMLAWTPRELAFLTPTDLGGAANYQRFCLTAGLLPLPDGYGLVTVVDKYGDHYTLVTSDVDFVRAIARATQTGVTAGMPVPIYSPNRIWMIRPGWPQEWTEPGAQTQ